MKILIINRSEVGGGAFVAGFRHLQALKYAGADVKMLVAEKTSDDEHVIGFPGDTFHKFIDRFRSVAEQLLYRFLIKDKKKYSLFTVDLFGKDISRMPLVKEADVIHIHWINFGVLSVQDLNKIILLGKPVVFTLHDMWLFTGGCHHADNCIRYQDQCGNCPQLKFSYRNDISTIRRSAKQKIVKDSSSVAVVACSHWMEHMATSSTILQNRKVLTIPNAIDINLYKPVDIAKKKKSILFISSNVGDERKGFKYFKECLQLLAQSLDKNEWEITVLGKYKPEYFADISFKVNAVGNISDQQRIADYYAESTVFIMPSLMDNLPNTIMESMSCGTPAVAFNIGGIPDLIDHKQNGYLAQYGSSEDLVKGVLWTLENYESASRYAREKVVREYSYDVVAKKHLELYQELMLEVGSLKSDL
jgi:glycosyltransferase involved in cell wall biosynthesis